MGLLDNLFKPKPDTSGERIVEGAAEAEVEAAPDGANDGHSTPGIAPRPPQFLAPKNYIPRSSVQVVPPTRGHPPAERRPASPEPETGSLVAKEIVLTLGDVLSRIPSHFLRQGVPDARRELRFPAEGLAADIARGRASVSLADIVAQCPEIFATDAEGFADVPIRLPLQKLVEQIGMTMPVARAATAATAITSIEPSPTVAIAEEPGIPPAASEFATTPGDMLSTADLSTVAPMPAPVVTQTLAPAAEQEIHLSLAAILKRCPTEIIVRPLPPVDESVRVTFPFAPIERQLPSGRVEVSSLRFIAALPLDLMKCFEAQAGVKVPLPLEEIFQNLPHRMLMTGVPVPTANPPPASPAQTAVEAPDVGVVKMVPTAGVEPGESAILDEPPANESIEPIEQVEQAVENERQNLEPSIFHEVQSPLEESASLADSTDTQTAASGSVEPGLVRAFVPSLRPPLLIRAQADSGVPETIFAELQAVDLSQVPVIEPAGAVVAPSGSSDAEGAPSAAPSLEIDPSAVSAERSELTAADPGGSDRGSQEVIARIAPQVRPIVVPPPPIFVTQLASQSEPQAAAPAPSQTEVGFSESSSPIIGKMVDESVRSAASGLVEFDALAVAPIAGPAVKELQPPSPAVVTSAASESIGPPPSPVSEPAPPGGRIAATTAPVELSKVAQLLAALPGIRGCVIGTHKSVIESGDLPPGLDAESLRDLARRMHRALEKKPPVLPAGEVEHLTLHAGSFSLSLFTRGDACVCAVHRARVFLPGVREKFAAVAEELGRLS